MLLLSSPPIITDKKTANANKTAPTTTGSRTGEITSGVGEGVIEAEVVRPGKEVFKVSYRLTKRMELPDA